MKLLKKSMLIGLILVSLTMHGQQNFITTGGQTNGVGGNASYSVGQIGYHTYFSQTGSLAEGLQQPYEISINTGIERTEIELEVTLYPNPTSDFLSLTIAEEQKGQLEVVLFDFTGKIIYQRVLENAITQFQMKHLAPASYFVQVRQNNKVVKIYTIIKN